ncbi:hypothetical protein [Allokutzneria oryzae]|uniref:Uncharacterized protein n=1 Tax=Allokutzneria oryzae TaxID=1378989 RepID=A0ABV5ZTG8_9PSEU
MATTTAAKSATATEAVSRPPYGSLTTPAVRMDSAQPSVVAMTSIGSGIVHSGSDARTACSTGRSTPVVKAVALRTPASSTSCGPVASGAGSPRWR